ncbi:MAG: GNAT family N-acetyltransferase [Hyphomicrobiales bacterium]|nr:GNAT family N-acetyltransferase [Hyphomicrobiales bacterium]
MSEETDDEDGFLETARLILRAPRPVDAAALAALANDPRVVENTGRLPYPYGEEDARRWIASPVAAREARFAIVLKPPDGRLVGVVGFDRLEGGDAPDLGYWLGEPHWGRGLATEAARAVVDFAFLAHGYKRLAAGCRITNAASRRVLEKCGFQYCGDDMMESRYFGGTVPVRRFRLDHGLWASLRQWGGPLSA